MSPVSFKKKFEVFTSPWLNLIQFILLKNATMFEKTSKSAFNSRSLSNLSPLIPSVTKKESLEPRNPFFSSKSKIFAVLIPAALSHKVETHEL